MSICHAKDVFLSFVADFLCRYVDLRKRHVDLSILRKGHVDLSILVIRTPSTVIVNHSLLMELLKNNFGVCNTAWNWLNSYLTARNQLVNVNNVLSDIFTIEHGVPQGSCLGPMLFTLYTSPIFAIIKDRGLHIHGYADDLQVYGTFDPGNTDNVLSTTQALRDCICDIGVWSKNNSLKLNREKTLYMQIGSQPQLDKVEHTSLVVNDCTIEKSVCVKNLGAQFDCNMNMETFVSQKCKSAYFSLYNIGKARKYLTYDCIHSLIHALVFSTLDYCNCLLAGITDGLIRKLQLVQNTAARILCGIGRYEHITPTLKHLHWLPVFYRIKFKLCLIVFKAINFPLSIPAYISDYIIVKTSPYNTRSNNTPTLRVPRTNHVTFGDRSFAVSAPHSWNALPASLRSINDLELFKKQLKAHFFRAAYF